jgi:hypothetical protein
MEDPQHSFEVLVASMRSDELKRIALRWGGSNKLRKEESLSLILDGLRDPERVRQVAARLPDLDRAALGLMQLAGGRLDAKALAAGLRALGVELPKGRGWHDRDDRMLIRGLIQMATVLSSYAREPTYVPEYGSTALVADPRLLAAVEPPRYTPLPIAPVEPPPAVLARRPATVGMDLAGPLRAIEGMGGLQLTKAGEVRAGDLRKLARALKWPDDALRTDGLSFPRPVAALSAALGFGALGREVDRLVVRDYHALVSRPYAEQVADLLRGFLQVQSWRESDDHSYATYEARYPAMRLALIVALAALPDIPGAFFAVDDVSAALFDRVGEHLSLSYGPHAPYFFNKTEAEVRRAEEEWRAKLRADWLKLERPWIEQALTSWIFFLGLVDLGFDHDALASVRLSELGRAVLHGESVADDAPEHSAHAWVVQPDFEVVVYLDHASPAQVALVERHAERGQSQSHVARYRLTRDSVYRGLETGTSAEQLLQVLREGAGATLPQNVQATLREWAAQRERIVLRRNVSLLEIPGELRPALESRLVGTPLGDRFVLLSDSNLALPHIHLDYARPLPPCLAATEDGRVTLAKPTPDLLIQAQLDRWAERVDDTTWRLTAASLAAAAKAGGTIASLLALLRERLTHPIPALLEVALRAWAGKAPAVALATVAVLRCSQPDVFAALAGSALLAPFLRGTLAPDVLLVDAARLDELRERLAWAGLGVSDTLEVS